MKRLLSLMLTLLLTAGLLLPCAKAEDTVLEPLWHVPDYVQWLLDVARGEIGYKEGPHGYSKYGEWAGDAYAQWCAEFLCWCVDQVDQQHGTELLRNVYPMYSGQNVGRDWFIRQGRYVTRNGNLANWGYQWMKDDDTYITTGTYIPQPGDWVFFTWTSSTDTDHVAMVEYCSQDAMGNITVHVIEGNTPVAVKRAEYALTYNRILGYGTVHDVADWTMRSGNSGQKVRELQEKLSYLGYLAEDKVDGVYGAATVEAVKAYQGKKGLKTLGIANIDTQKALNDEYRLRLYTDPNAWAGVVDDNEEDDDLDWEGQKVLLTTAFPRERRIHRWIRFMSADTAILIPIPWCPPWRLRRCIMRWATMPMSPPCRAHRTTRRSSCSTASAFRRRRCSPMSAHRYAILTTTVRRHSAQVSRSATRGQCCARMKICLRCRSRMRMARSTGC